MKKVLIPTKLDPVAADILKSHQGYSVVQDAEAGLDALVSAHPDTYALIVRSEKVTAELIDRLPELKCVVRAGAGYNTIDIRYARSRGIDVMNTPGANANAVAEEVLALILADARHLIPADATTRMGEWAKSLYMGRELAGKTVGIVGLGNIGRLVARRLRGFECTLLGYDPLVSHEKAREADVEPVELQTLFEQADFITLHIPETDETRGLVDDALLSRMKPGATIVNCARAGIIDEEALRRHKQTHGVRFLNDVYAKDAAGKKSVADIADIMLPHLGASTVEANRNAAQRAAQQLIDLVEKGVTSFIVNRGIPEGLDETYCELAFALARLARDLLGRNIPLKMIETSFYGQLKPFAQWLLAPMISGIWEDLGRSVDYDAAVAYLDEMGIDYADRATDPGKGFENSVTIDLIGEQDDSTLKRVSVRGTVAEGVLMVSRINGFDRLYFEPVGPTLFFLYDDRPGVIAAISRKLAEGGINIEDMRNPHDRKTDRSLAILKVNQPVADDVMAAIKAEIDAASAICVEL